MDSKLQESYYFKILNLLKSSIKILSQKFQQRQRNKKIPRKVTKTFIKLYREFEDFKIKGRGARELKVLRKIKNWIDEGLFVF